MSNSNNPSKEKEKPEKKERKILPGKRELGPGQIILND